jgi:plastocyanin
MERSSRPVLALRPIAFFGVVLATACAQAAPVTVQVMTTNGEPLADAAVYAESESVQVLPKPVKTVEIEQKGRAFLPRVTVIQTGTNVSFPNNDTVRHHVYSFSPAKPFELKLYAGEPTNPVNFDKPGTVVIGCNIHDQMSAYIQVVPTLNVAKTDSSGKARLDGLPAGKYRLKAWHFALPAGTPAPEQTLNVAANEAVASFTLNVKAN